MGTKTKAGNETGTETGLQTRASAETATGAEKVSGFKIYGLHF